VTTYFGTLHQSIIHIIAYAYTNAIKHTVTASRRTPVSIFTAQSREWLRTRTRLQADECLVHGLCSRLIQELELTWATNVCFPCHTNKTNKSFLLESNLELSPRSRERWTQSQWSPRHPCIQWVDGDGGFESEGRRADETRLVPSSECARPSCSWCWALSDFTHEGALCTLPAPKALGPFDQLNQSSATKKEEKIGAEWYSGGKLVLERM